jgi:hypothetical protein
MPALKLNPDGTPHLHIYERMRSTKDGSPTKFYRCTHPNCVHKMHKREIEGKEAICAICKQNRIILTKYNLELARPRCEECSNSSAAREKRLIQEQLKEMGIG